MQRFPKIHTRELMICTVCRSPALETVLSLGEQPVSSRFVLPGAAAEELHPLSLGYCRDCGTIQLTERMPLNALRPQYDWLIYTEPEGHLDNLAATIASLPGLGPRSAVLGMTYKDASTITRLSRLGFAQAYCVSIDDLQPPVTPCGIETVQALLSDRANIERLLSLYRKADVLIARHIMEHASDASGMLRTLRLLMAHDGYLVLELPDSERFLRLGNHAFVWEEHISYFTASSLRGLARQAGAAIVHFARYRYAYEDSLVAILRFDGAPEETATNSQDLAALFQFADSLVPTRAKWRDAIERQPGSGDQIVVYGAGHLGAKFINFLSLSDLIDCVVDDHPAKHGMLMPGSRLPIVPSSDLSARRIRLCISTLSPESEIRVRPRIAELLRSGGSFVSAFATD